MKKGFAITVCILLLLPCCITAQEKGKEKKPKAIFNAGFKAGFQAITYNDPEFNIDGYTYNKSTIQSNKIGYSIAPFFRLSYGRLYLQTDAAFGITRHSFDFTDSNTATIENIVPNSTVYELKTYCLQVPLLIGYDVLKKDGYGMSIFTGPRTKFIFTAQSEQKFKHFAYEGLEEVLNDKVYYWEIGLGVKIYNVFFDFVYDLGLTDTSKQIISEKEGKAFSIKHRDNILSFSVGMIF